MSDLTEAAEALNILAGKYGVTRDQLVEVAGGPADGGPGGDGFYPITRADGTDAMMPSIAKILSLTSGVRGLVRQSWAELSALAADTELGTTATVDAGDTGEHTEPGGAEPVPNAGYYELVAGTPNYFKRTGNLLVTDLGDLRDQTIDARNAAQNYAADAELLVGSTPLMLDELIGKAAFETVAVAGAVARGGRGLTFPVGAGSGFGSSVRSTVRRTEDMKAGEVYTYRVRADASALFTRTMLGTIYVIGAVSGPRDPASPPRYVQSAGKFFLEIDVEIEAGDADYIFGVGPDIIFGVEHEEWFDLTSIKRKLRTPHDDTQTANEAMLQTILATTLRQYSLRFGLGDVLEDASLLRSLASGAVEDGRWGLLFPDGTDGKDTTALVSYPIDADAHAGRKMVLVVAFRKGPGFTRTLAPGFLVATTVHPEGAAPGSLSLNHPGAKEPEEPGRPVKVETVFEDDGFAIYVIEYSAVVGDLKLLPYTQQTSTTDTTTDERLTLAGLLLGYMTAVWPGLTPADEALADAIGRRAGGEAPKYMYRRVNADDHGGPFEAMASITRATAGFWHGIDLGPGTYDLTDEIYTKDFVTMQGKGPDQTFLRLALPNDAPAEQIAATSAIYADRTGRYGGFSLEVWNCRYGIHCDTGATVMNRVIEFQHIRVLHHGNDDAPANVWGGQNPMGCGVSGGGELRVFDFYLWSKNGNAFSAHNNVNATLPARVHLKRGVLAPGAHGKDVMVVLAIGSRQADQWITEDTVIGGPWQFSTQGWYHSDLLNNPANHWEWDISGSGNTPAVFRNQDQGLALRIDSATKGPGSSVVIGGDMKPLLFGDGVVGRSFKRKGSPGFSAAEWGFGDVSGFPESNGVEIVLRKPQLLLGRRAGNRTASLRMLTVAIDGNAPVNIVFNADYTNASQEFILDMIQDAIGAAGVVSLYNPGARERPRFFDEEFAPLITATMPATNPADPPVPTGIEMGLVCAFDGDPNKVRLMTADDPAGLFAGVAWADCPHNQPGRVKSRGFLPINDIARSDPGEAFVFGDTFSIDPAKPGQIIKGGTQALFRAISNDAVALRAGS